MRTSRREMTSWQLKQWRRGQPDEPDRPAGWTFGFCSGRLHFFRAGRIESACANVERRGWGSQRNHDVYPTLADVPDHYRRQSPFERDLYCRECDRLAQYRPRGAQP